MSRQLTRTASLEKNSIFEGKTGDRKFGYHSWMQNKINKLLICSASMAHHEYLNELHACLSQSQDIVFLNQFISMVQH
jgi:hypothetical protein